MKTCLDIIAFEWVASAAVQDICSARVLPTGMSLDSGYRGPVGVGVAPQNCYWLLLTLLLETSWM